METTSTSVSTGDVAKSPGDESAKIKRPAPTKILPNERLTLERQIAALRAYAAIYESKAGQAVTNEDAGTVAKMAAATIVMTNAWFVDIGFLSRTDGGFSVGSEAVAFLNAENGIAPESAPEKLKPLFERYWATQLVLPRVRVGSLPVDTVVKIIGEHCGASKEHIPRIELLVDFMCYVGLFRKEGGEIKMNTPSKGGEPIVQLPPSRNGGSGDSHQDEQTKGLETYTLTLDPVKGRRVIIKAPPEVSAAELKRIQQWLSFQLIVSDVNQDG